MASEEACRTLCAANATCNSYTWTPGAKPKDDCHYTHNCWWRDDSVWDLKDTHSCLGQSGYKGVPPVSPSPSPSSPGPGPAPAPIPPAPKDALNVLFVIFDDLRIMHGAWGFHGQAHTPNTDAFANRSLIFDNAYCQQAVCGPSRASLISGRRPDSTQMWNFVGGFRQTPGAETWNTWPEWFRKRGYFTAGVGKLFHPGDPKDFDPQSWTGNKYSGYFGQDSCPKKSPNSHGCPVTDPKHVYPDVETLTIAKSLLGQAKNGSVPFWIGVGFVKPHMPHVFPAKYLDVVPALENIQLAAHPLPPSGGGGVQLDWTGGKGSDGPVGQDTDFMNPTDNATAADWRRSYYAAAAFSDDLFGELLAELDRLQLSDNTIVIMTADHGWGLGTTESCFIVLLFFKWWWWW